MIDMLIRLWQNVLERTEGPMNLRFFLQPGMAIFFAIRAAFKDVKNNHVPYLKRFANAEGTRKEVAKEAWKDFGKVFIIAIILDIVYQLVVIFKFKTESNFYPLESIVVSFLLSFIPYIFFRGPVSRLVSYFSNRGKKEK